MNQQDYELIKAAARELRPYVPWFMGLLIVLFARIAVGETPSSIIKTVVTEFTHVLKVKATLESLNAMTIILAFILVLALFAFEPVKDILLPILTKRKPQDFFIEGIEASLVVIFLCAGMF